MLKANLEPSSTPVELFASENGQTRWWSVRAQAELRSGTGALVTLKVNGNDVNNEVGGFYLHVDDSAHPTRSSSADILLADGDAVTAVVDGPSGTVLDLRVQACVFPDELEADDPPAPEAPEEPEA